jgi:hypothetical protein
MGRVGGAGREVGEERLVGRQRLLLTDERDRLLGEVLHQVIVRVIWRIDRAHAVDERRRPLVGLAPDEPVEALKAAVARPVVKRAGRTGLPHGHLVALAELGSVVAGLAKDLRQGSGRVGPSRAIARGWRRGLGDVAHADLVVIAPGEQRSSGRRAQGGGVKARVLQPVVGEALGGRGGDRATESARCAEADVVEQNHEHVGCVGRRALGLYRRPAAPQGHGHRRPAARHTPGPEPEGPLLLSSAPFPDSSRSGGRTDPCRHDHDHSRSASRGSCPRRNVRRPAILEDWGEAGVPMDPPRVPHWYYQRRLEE